MPHAQAHSQLRAQSCAEARCDSAMCSICAFGMMHTVSRGHETSTPWHQACKGRQASTAASTSQCVVAIALHTFQQLARCVHCIAYSQFPAAIARQTCQTPCARVWRPPVRIRCASSQQLSALLLRCSSASKQAIHPYVIYRDHAVGSSVLYGVRRMVGRSRGPDLADSRPDSASAIMCLSTRTSTAVTQLSGFLRTFRASALHTCGCSLRASTAGWCSS